MSTTYTKLSDYPENLRLYVFHGIHFDDPALDKPKADCPFCGAENHFVVIADTGAWRCLKCSKGNQYSFIQQLLALALRSTDESVYTSVAAERKPLTPETLKSWRLCAHPLEDALLQPAYNTQNNLSNLYKIVRSPSGHGFVVMSSPGMKAHPFGRHLLPPAFNTLELCEGPWDAMALWQARQAKPDKLQPAILGLAGASSQSELTHYLSPTLPPEKSGLPLTKPLSRLNLYFDNDKGGQDAVYQIHKALGKFRLATHPDSVNVLAWPKLSVSRGYVSSPDNAEFIYKPVKPVGKFDQTTYAGVLNPDLPGGLDGKHGFDLRDLLARKPTTGLTTLSKILARLVLDTSPKKKEEAPAVEPLPCISFTELCDHWSKTILFNQDLRDALAIALATSCSTPLGGDSQLWFRIIGAPGSGKSTIAEAMAVAKEYVYSKSIIRGFHSGYTGGGGGRDEEASLIPKIRNKTVAWKDADTLTTAPSFKMIMAEMRDIYDRVSRTAYRNKQGEDFEDIPVTFVLCGTHDLRAATDCDAVLGSRFLDCEIHVDKETNKLLSRVQDNEIEQLTESLITRQRASSHTLNGESSDVLPPTPNSKLLKQYTYGFIKHLREHTHTPPTLSTQDKQAIKEMAELLSFLRARVSRDGGELRYRPQRESPTRITQQLTRLAFCLAIVLDRPAIDDAILRIVRKVVSDTGHGFGYEIIFLLASNPTGLSALQITRRLNLPETTVRRLLVDLQELSMAKRVQQPNNSGQRGRDVHLWSLVPSVSNLFHSVYSNRASVSASPKKIKSRAQVSKDLIKKGNKRA